MQTHRHGSKRHAQRRYSPTFARNRSKKSGKWQAAVNVGGINLYLGSHDDEAEAARLFDRVAVRIGRRKLNFRRV